MNQGFRVVVMMLGIVCAASSASGEIPGGAPDAGSRRAAEIRAALRQIPVREAALRWQVTGADQIAARP